MDTKVFEIRDEGTCMVALCMHGMPMDATNEHEQYLLRRDGWGIDQEFTVRRSPRRVGTLAVDCRRQSAIRLYRGKRRLE